MDIRMDLSAVDLSDQQLNDDSQTASRKESAGQQPAKRETYFHQDCPACGRKLRIRIDHLGQSVACQHCDSQFIATDGIAGNENLMLARADQLLSRCSDDNEALRERIGRYLRRQGVQGLKAVEFEIDRGAVVLRGRIGSLHDRWLCQNSIQRVAGVLRVIDALENQRHDAARPS